MMLNWSSLSPPEGWGSQKPPLGALIDRGHPLSPGLRFLALLNEGAGGRVNDSASQQVGALQNAATTNCWGARPGWLTLDGVDDRVDFASVIDPVFKPMTVAISFIMNAQSANHAYLWAAADATETSCPVILYITDGGLLSLQYSGPAGTTRTLTAALIAGTRYTAVGTHTGSYLGTDMHLYLNGVEPAATTTNGSGTVAAPGRWSLGGRTFDNLRNFNGAIAWAAWWNRVLAPNHVRQLLAEPYGMFEAGMPFAAGACGRPLLDGSLASGPSLLGAIA